jgi:hypothetical protein
VKFVAFKGSAARMVVVARSVPTGAAAKAAAGRAFDAGVVRKVDAGAGRVLHDGGSAGTGGGGSARRCWRATRSMRAMAVFLGVGGYGYLIWLHCRPRSDAGGPIPHSILAHPNAATPQPAGRLRRRGVERCARFLVDELDADGPSQLQRLVFPGATDEGSHFD